MLDCAWWRIAGHDRGGEDGICRATFGKIGRTPTATLGE